MTIVFELFKKNDGWSRDTLGHQAQKVLVVFIAVFSDLMAYLMGGSRFDSTPVWVVHLVMHCSEHETLFTEMTL